MEKRTDGRLNMKRLGKLWPLPLLSYHLTVVSPFYREAIKEDDSGRIQSSVDEIMYKSIRKRILNQKNVRLGMVREIKIEPILWTNFTIFL